MWKNKITNVKANITEQALLNILSPSVFNPTPERVRNRAEVYQQNENTSIYAYAENGEYLGVVVFEMKEDSATIFDIAVDTKHQHKGIGSRLIDFIFKEFHATCVYAETDDDAIGFYKKYGFTVYGTYLKFDTMRYQCVCKNAVFHYNTLIDENNDPVHDPAPLREYMDQWDGQEFINKMGLNSGKTVLEIGVGTGRLALRVAPLCGEFCGIDISPKTIERAKENLAELKNTSLVCGDFLTYEFGCSFDVIYSSLTFMHIEEKQEATNKVARLLNGGGRFVLSIDKNQSDSIDLGTRKIKLYPDVPEKIAGYIVDAGLTIIEQYETAFATVLVGEKK